MSLSQWGLLVFLSLLWGGSFLFVGMAVHDLPPLTLVLARVGLAALALLPVVYAIKLRLPTELRAWQPFLVMSLLNNIIPFLLIVRGQREIASGLASVLNATTPLFAVIIAHVFTTDEKLTAPKLAGVLTGIAGVSILVGPEAMFGQPANLFGMVLILGAACSYGFSALWGRRFKETPPLVTATSQLICSTAILLPLALVIDRPWALLALPKTSAILAVIGLAFLSTALAYIVFFRIMAISGPTNTMLVTLLIPVSAIAFGTVFLGEVLLPRHIAGALVIATALVILDGRVFNLLARRSAPPA
ncbi:MAG: DMT family transporter [Hyphomicrobiaceae bacterium]